MRATRAAWWDRRAAARDRQDRGRSVGGRWVIVGSVVEQTAARPES
ncbi:hypothetical protein ACQPWW_11230 [Micromonospora sp. CA-240977]